MKPESPTPLQVDEKAKKYYELQADLLQKMLAAREAQVPLQQLKTELIELVKDFGSTHAEKSKLLHGIEDELMATFGSSTSADAAAIERFRLALVQKKQGRLLKRIFEKSERWTLSAAAATIIKGEKLTPSLLALYSQCSVTEPSTPRLEVRPKKKGRDPGGSGT